MLSAVPYVEGLLKLSEVMGTMVAFSILGQLVSPEPVGSEAVLGLWGAWSHTLIGF